MTDTASDPSKGLPSLWKVVLFIFIVTYLARWVHSYNRLRHFPGPTLAKFSNLWMILATTSGRSHLKFYECDQKYGKLYRIAPNTLMTSDPDLIRKMSVLKSPYHRAPWYRAFKFDADIENVVSVTDDDLHTQMRSKRAPGYSGKDNPYLEDSVNKVIFSMVHLIERKYLSDASTYRPCDLAKILQYFTLDVITSLSLSHPFGYLDSDSDVYGYVKMVDDNFPIMSFMSVVPLVSTITRSYWFKKLTSPSIKDRVGMGKVKGVSRDIVARRYGENKEIEQDMIGSFVKHGLSPTEAADETLLQMVAGSDTIATTLRTLLTSIYTTPAVLSRLVDELVPYESTYPLDDSHCIPHATLLTLPFLNACVKEGLRIHPAATGIQPKITPATGDTLPDGTFIPPGTQIGQCAWGIGRNTEIFGNDASLFRPERWLPSEYNPPENIAKMERHASLLFGHSRFQCLGMLVAKYEVLKCVAEFVRRYEVRIAGTSDMGGPFKHNINFGIFLQSGLEARIENRTVA